MLRLLLSLLSNSRIILLDLDLGTDSGFDLLPEVRQLVPDARLTILTGMRDNHAHQRAVLLGAMGLVLKEKALDSLLTAIEKVYQGEVWLDRTMIASLLNSRARSGTELEQNPYAAQIVARQGSQSPVFVLLSTQPTYAHPTAHGLHAKMLAFRSFLSYDT
jgi:DNA-binding NarL/FixJ family response regulator